MKNFIKSTCIIVILFFIFGCNKSEITDDNKQFYPVKAKRVISIEDIDYFGELHSSGLDLLSEDAEFPTVGNMDFTVLFSELLDDVFGTTIPEVWEHVEELMENPHQFDDFSDLSDYLATEYSVSSTVQDYLDGFDYIVDEVAAYDETEFKSMIADVSSDINEDEDLSDNEKHTLMATLSILKYSYDYWTVVFENDSEWDENSDELMIFNWIRLLEALECDAYTYCYVVFECMDAGWGENQCNKMATAMATYESFGIWIPV